jgi:hypothetical protein
MRLALLLGLAVVLLAARATIVTSCDPCMSGFAVGLHGEGYNPSKRVEIHVAPSTGGDFVYFRENSVSPSGILDCAVDGFSEPGLYTVSVFQGHGRAMATATFTLVAP